MRPTLLLGILVAGATLAGCLRVVASIPKGPSVSISTEPNSHEISWSDNGDGMSSINDGGGPEVQGTGDSKEETRNVDAFHGVAVSSIIRLTYAQGSTSSVQVSAQESVLPCVKTAVKDGVLTVDLAPGNYHHLKPIVVTVSSPQLDSIELSGVSQGKATGIQADNLRVEVSGNSTLDIQASCKELNSEVSGEAKLTGQLTAEQKSVVEISGNATAQLAGPSRESLQVEVSGAGTLTLTGIATDNLTCTLTGSSTVSATGSAKAGDVTAEGASQAEMKDFAIDVCQAQASGASHVEVNVNRTLKADASGASNIHYSGHPTVDRSTSGVSSISGP